MKIQLLLIKQAIEKELLETGIELTPINMIDVDVLKLSKNQRKFIIENFDEIGKIFVPGIEKKNLNKNPIYTVNGSIPVNSLNIEEIIIELQAKKIEIIKKQKIEKYEIKKKEARIKDEEDVKKQAIFILTPEITKLEEQVKEAQAQAKKYEEKYEELRIEKNKNAEITENKRIEKIMEKAGFSKIDYDPEKYDDDYESPDYSDIETKRLELIINREVKVECWTNRESEESILVYRINEIYYTK